MRDWIAQIVIIAVVAVASWFAWTNLNTLNGNLLAIEGRLLTMETELKTVQTELGQARAQVSSLQADLAEIKQLLQNGQPTGQDNAADPTALPVRMQNDNLTPAVAPRKH